MSHKFKFMCSCIKFFWILGNARFVNNLSILSVCFQQICFNMINKWKHFYWCSLVTKSERFPKFVSSKPSLMITQRIPEIRDIFNLQTVEMASIHRPNNPAGLQEKMGKCKAIFAFELREFVWSWVAAESKFPRLAKTLYNL